MNSLPRKFENFFFFFHISLRVRGTGHQQTNPSSRRISQWNRNCYKGSEGKKISFSKKKKSVITFFFRKFFFGEIYTFFFDDKNFFSLSPLESKSNKNGKKRILWGTKILVFERVNVFKEVMRLVKQLYWKKKRKIITENKNLSFLGSLINKLSLRGFNMRAKLTFLC